MRAYVKNILKQVSGTMGRFLSIAIISMLGVGSFAGLRSVSPDMKMTADKYYADQSLMDIYAVSTLGFSDNDIAAVRRDGLTVMPSYMLDALVRKQGGDSDTVVKVYAAQQGDPLNHPVILKGRLPELQDECALDADLMDRMGANVGDVVVLASGKEDPITDTLVDNAFTVVGEVVSPLYVSFDYGGSTVGDGKAHGALFLHEDAFDLEVHTALFISIGEAQGLPGSGQEYKDVIQAALDSLELIAERREVDRYSEIMDEANEKIADAEAELADGERERTEKLADAQAKIDDAKVKIADAEAELADGRTKFDREIAKAERELADAERELLDGEQEIAEKELEIEDGLREIEDGKTEIAENEEKLKEAEQELQDGYSELAAAGGQMNEGKAQLEDAQRQVDELGRYIQYLQSQQDPALEPEIQRSQAMYEAGAAALEDGRAKLESGGKEKSAGWAAYDRGKAEYDEGKAEIAKAKADIAEAEAELEDGIVKLQEAKEEIAQGFIDLEQGKRDLAKARREGLAELDDADQKIADAKAELEDGEREFKEQEAESGQKITDAHAELDDAKKKLADVEQPEWYLFTREDLPSNLAYYNDAEKIAAIGVVFPLVFFAVAVLISLTTMSRMVDEQRGMIGTLKMLGYERGAIAIKYVLYAFASCAVGCVGGLFLGRYFFPWVIVNAYSIKYRFPPVLLPFQWEPSMIALLSNLLLVIGAAYFAVRKELTKTPAHLLRPRAPKPGKRIFLERIGPIWRHLPFSWKVTLRNIFRYKTRFIMTIAGIAGCTALLLTGFGLKDSLDAVPKMQFDRVWKYDLMVAVEEKKLPEGREGIDALCEARGAYDIQWWRQESVTVKAQKDGAKFESNAVILDDAQQLKTSVSTQTFPQRESVAWEGDGALVTYKLAKLLGVGPGDTLTIADSDGKERTALVAQVVENYIGHYLFLTKDAYFAQGEAYEHNIAVMSLTDTSQEAQGLLATELTATDGVLMRTFTTDTRDTIADMFGSLNVIVFVLIVAAGALALAVLFNLNNINIAERVRELATIKVLGFMRYEVMAYVTRESLILTIIGIAAGCVAGIFLHGFVMSTAEMDDVMFGRNIEWLSYLYSILLTFAFSAIVSIATIPKLNSINMVESLKSVE